MIRWLLLFGSLGLAGWALLTAVEAPNGVPWQLALLAGEFGLGFGALPIALALLAWRTRSNRVWLATITFGVNLVASLFLLKPTVQAWQIGQTLSTRLDAAFGPAVIERTPFSPFRGWTAGSTPVAVETLTYAPGLAMDFYRAVDRRNAPCVIVIHGGGWDGGDRRQLPELNHRLARRGYAVAAMAYRLAPAFRWPAQGEDVRAALGFLQVRSTELGIDPTAFVLLGRSAGGQLAETVGYTAGDPAIRGVIALYAPADLPFAWSVSREDDILNAPRLMRQLLGGTPATAASAYESASSIFAVNSSTPPTLLLHGRLDPLVWHRQSERLAARLTAAGVPHVLVSLPWATHAFDFNLAGPGGQLTTYAIEWFLAAVTRKARTSSANF